VTPLRLLVLKNGERNSGSAISVVGPNLTNVSLMSLLQGAPFSAVCVRLVTSELIITLGVNLLNASIS